MKTLAAKRVPLHHVDPIGQCSRLAAEQADDQFRPLAQRLGMAERVKALGRAAIDKPHGGGVGFDDIAERFEGSFGQRMDSERIWRHERPRRWLPLT